MDASKSEDVDEHLMIEAVGTVAIVLTIAMHLTGGYA